MYYLQRTWVISTLLHFQNFFVRGIFGQIVLCGPFWLLFYFSFIFPCAAVKRTWTRWDNGAGSRKIYYWDLFARLPSTDIAKAKVMNDTCFEILPAVNCSREENFIGWEVYLSWNMWEFYENGRVLQCYGSGNFLTFRSILQSNKAERYVPENKSMRCDKLDGKSLLFSPWAPICFVTNKDFLNQSKEEIFSQRLL